jgi:pseudaminic acid synthase
MGSDAGRIHPHEGPLIVAEVSGNHMGSLQRAREIIEMVAAAGCPAVKLQTYRPDTITLPVETANFRLSDDHELWGSRTLWDLYEEAHTPWEWHEELFALGRDLGMTVFSTPFDETAVDFLESLDCPIYKIASLEIIDLPLIRAAAATGKPLIISTGAATLVEVDAAVTAARGAGCTDLTLLVCTSSYPADPAEANLRRMNLLAQRFNAKIGLSDHTMGLGVSIAAVALGASVIEKHVTLDRADGGVDSAFSLDRAELSQLIVETHAAFVSLGTENSWQTSSEAESMRFRPSLYVSRAVSAGEAVSSDNVRSVRPTGGLAPDMFSVIEGRIFATDLSMGTPMSLDLLS